MDLFSAVFNSSSKGGGGEAGKETEVLRNKGSIH